APWIQTEYANQSSPNTFYSYSGEGVEIRSSSVAGVKVRGGPSSASSWYDSGWAYRKKITINPSKVSGGHSNFPMLFSRIDPDLRDTLNGGNVASSSGGDILFTDADNNKIPHEIEKYTDSTGELIAWVNVPFVSSTSTRDIYIYYGNDTIPLANQQNPTGVWDSDFKLVLHLKEDPTSTCTGTKEVCDSTSNDNDGDAENMEAGDLITGKIGSALNFGGTNEDIVIGTGLRPTTALTVSTWVNANSLVVGGSWFGDLNYNSGNPHGTQFDFDGGGVGYFRAGDGTANAVATANPVTMLTIGTWNHLVVTWGGTNTTKLYLNGTLLTNTENGIDTTTITYTGAPGLTFAKSNVNADAKMDEIRVSTSVRTAPWIQTEYANQSSPNTFYSYSGEGVEIRASTVAGIKVRGGVNIRGGVKFR
ncbi:MAG: hypothetical protein CO183_02715, partial [Candidatus Zambryskibacteria bacterium CG_4_9_14_3_um_filter_42_9]